MPDWNEFQETREKVRENLFKGRTLFAIVFCPLVGILLFVMAVREKSGMARLSFVDVWPAISISLAGIMYVVLYRFIWGKPITPTLPPEETDDKSSSPPSTHP